MKLLIDVRGTLMLGDPRYKDPNKQLIQAIESYYDKDKTVEIIVWSWLEDEAEKALKHLTVPAKFQKKDYETVEAGDLIVDDKLSDWPEHYRNGAQLMTPEQFMEEYS